MQRMAVLQEEKAADAGFLQSRTLRRMTITGQNRYNQLLPQPASVVTTIAPASARLNALFFIVFPPDLNLVNLICL